MKHILILSGGNLNINFAREYIKTLSYDKVFAVDKGLEYSLELNLIPDYSVGDFDTVKKEVLEEFEERIRVQQLDSLIEKYPVKKDATDTELAIIKAIEEKAEIITILGATGSRIDHVLANIGILFQTARNNIICYLVDETNRIRLLLEGYCSDCRIKKREQHGVYLSLIPMNTKIGGVTMEGVMYPLKRAVINQGSSLTISNQIVADEAYISVETGSALVIESRD